MSAELLGDRVEVDVVGKFHFSEVYVEQLSASSSWTFQHDKFTKTMNILTRTTVKMTDDDDDYG